MNLARMVFAISAVWLCWVVSCTTDQRPLDDRLHDAAARRLSQYDVRGASTCVILPDGNIHNIVAGISHDSVAIRPEMLFATGSITKNMLAALVLRLVEEGVLYLEDSLHKWLPPHPMIDSNITIRQMLGHTSGIFMFWENQNLWDDLIKYRDSVFSPEVVLTYLKESHFPPGTGFLYSNTNYLLLAQIITRATNSTLSSELRRHFWQPLRLSNTYLSMEELIPQDKLAHVWGDNFEKSSPERDLTYLPRASHESITYGSSGVFTTAEDLATWCKSLFAGKVLTQSSLDQMLQFNPAAAGSWCDGYGLGVFLIKKSTADGNRAYGHGGGNIGTSAYMVYLPDYDVSIVVMINSFHGKCPDRILKDMIEIVTDYLDHGSQVSERNDVH